MLQYELETRRLAGLQVGSRVGVYWWELYRLRSGGVAASGKSARGVLLGVDAKAVLLDILDDLRGRLRVDCGPGTSNRLIWVFPDLFL